jgi:hypothetical protein
MTRTDSAPARWPSIRLRFLSLAQRPLPSIMMARCRGRLSNLLLSDVGGVGSVFFFDSFVIVFISHLIIENLII